MKIGVPKEIKTLEFRVGMVPAGVRELVHDGHQVIVEPNAGAGIGLGVVDFNLQFDYTFSYHQLGSEHRISIILER